MNYFRMWTVWDLLLSCTVQRMTINVEDFFYLRSHTRFCSLTPQSDQFKAIYSLSAGFAPSLVCPAQKACTLHQNMLL